MTRSDLDAALRHAVVLGALAVLLLPGARGSSEWLGWMPLWLLGMPLAAWWTLRGCRVPAIPLQLPRRGRASVRRGPQARRTRRDRAPERVYSGTSA